MIVDISEVNNMNKYGRIYMKYVIKSPFLFYAFWIGGIILFLAMTLNTKIAVMKTFEVQVVNDTVVLDGIQGEVGEIVYLYTDRNERVYKAAVYEKRDTLENTVLILEDGQPDMPEGRMKADIVIGEDSLLRRVFMKAGRES